MTISFVGRIGENGAVNNTTLPVIPVNLGDLVIGTICNEGGGLLSSLPSSASSGGVTTWTSIPSSANTGVNVAQGWWGVVTSTGSATWSLSGTSGSWATDTDYLAMWEFSSSISGSWALDKSTSLSSQTTSSSVMSSPALAPTGSGSGELSFYMWSCASQAAAGTTSGYSYPTTGSSHVTVGYDLSVSAVTQPNAGNSGSYTYGVFGAIFVCNISPSRSNTEALTTADAVSRAVAIGRGPNENLATADAEARSPQSFSRSVTQALATVDAVGRAATLPRALPETLSLVDSETIQRSKGRSTVEPLGLVDTKARSLVVARSKAEALALLDTGPLPSWIRTESLFTADSVSPPVLVPVPVPPSWQEAIQLPDVTAWVRVSVFNAQGVWLADLKILTGSVTDDETAQIRRTLQLILAIEATDLEDLSGLIPLTPGDLLNPVSMNEIVVSRGLTFTNGTQLSAQLGVFRMSVPKIADTGSGLQMTITGYDRSVLLSACKWLQPYNIAAGTNVGAAVQAMLNNQWPSGLPPLLFNLVPTSDVTGALSFGTSTTAGQNDPFADAMSVANTAGGMELFFDTGSGHLPNAAVVMRPVPDPTTSPVLWAFVEGQGGLGFPIDRTLDETNTYNGVIATGTGVSGEPITVTVWITDPDSPINPYTTNWGFRPYIMPAISTIPAPGQDTTDATTQLTAVATAQLQLLANELNDCDFTAMPLPAMKSGDCHQLTRSRIGIDDAFVASKIVHPLDLTSNPIIPMQVTDRARVAA